MRLNGLREYKLYISDMQKAISKIQEYITGLDKDSFAIDGKTNDSVLHNLMVIGEAANKIPSEIRENYPDINWKGIIGMRNIITHGYFSVNSDIIWKTVTERLLELQQQLNKIL